MADALRGLLLGADGAAAQQLPATAMRAAALLGAREMVLYLVDYGQLALVPMAAPGTPERDVLPIEGTLAGRVYARTEMQQSADASGERLWIPLLDGTERLGVLEVCTTAGDAARSRADFEAVAGLFAGLVSTGRAYSDQVELTRRRIPMQLAAEIVWSLLPPSTFANAQVTISGILEPCYDVGGDAFDYAVNGDVLHAAIFDTVGHGIEACALTSLTVSAYRNARRCGLDLVDTYRSIDKWVHARYPGGFVTALLAELDTRRGRYRRICAGHPGELLMREGSLVKALPTPTALPLGLSYLDGMAPDVDEEALEPGDQLLLYTDGVVEARDVDGEFFGRARLADFLTRTLAGGVSTPEALRRLVHAILGHQHGQLQDDASAVLIGWPSTGPGAVTRTPAAPAGRR